MSPSTASVYFFYERPVYLRHRTPLKKFIASLFRAEGYRLHSLNYIFCTDKRVLEINKQFLNHDFYTDIITFGLSVPGQPVEGEIYISADRVEDNSKEVAEPFTREIHRVIFHGALHLCGYRDKTIAEQREMRKKEDFYLQRYAVYLNKSLKHRL